MVKYSDSTKSSLEYRLHARARNRWPPLTTVEVRHRGTFSYVDGVLTDGTVMKLCRLRPLPRQSHRLDLTPEELTGATTKARIDLGIHDTATK